MHSQAELGNEKNEETEEKPVKVRRGYSCAFPSGARTEKLKESHREVAVQTRSSKNNILFSSQSKLE